MRSLFSPLLVVASCSSAPAGNADASPTYAHDLASLTDTCAGDPSLTGAHALAMIGPMLTTTYAPSEGGGSPTTLTISLTPSSPLFVRCEPSAPPFIRLAVSAAITTSDGTFAGGTYAGELDLLTDPSGPPLAFTVSSPVMALSGA